MKSKLKKHFIYILFIAISFWGCGYNKQLHSIDRDIALASSLNIDPQIIRLLKSYGINEFEPAHIWFHKGYLQDELVYLKPVFLEGFAFRVKSPAQNQIFYDLKDDLKEKGYSIFIVDDDYNSLPSNRNTFAVLNTTDKYQIIKQMVVEDSIRYTNYKTNRDISVSVDHLNNIIKDFDDKYSLELYYASKGHLQFIVNGYVDDWEKLVRALQEVLPYAVPTNDIGIVDISSIAEEMKYENKMTIWLYN